MPALTAVYPIGQLTVKLVVAPDGTPCVATTDRASTT
jgi:hypothetical protein